jgi:hypothetical protein
MNPCTHHVPHHVPPQNTLRCVFPDCSYQAVNTGDLALHEATHSWVCAACHAKHPWTLSYPICNECGTWPDSGSLFVCVCVHECVSWPAHFITCWLCAPVHTPCRVATAGHCITAEGKTRALVLKDFASTRSGVRESVRAATYVGVGEGPRGVERLSVP